MEPAPPSAVASASQTAAATPAQPAPRPVVFKKRALKGNVSKTYRPPPPPPSDSGSDSSLSDNDQEGAPKRALKRRRVGETSALQASNVAARQAQSADGDGKNTLFAADRSTTMEASNDAVKQSAWFADDDDDKAGGKAKAAGDKGDANKKSFGPIKAPANIRTVTIIDYKPDVCKDYKLTGFCGFGDNCKFLHSRDDFAAGWQLDKQWEALSEEKKKGGTVVASAARRGRGGDGAKHADDEAAATALLEKIPFVCLICKQSYKQPIKTKCNHYFCEACALKRFRKDQSCAACGAATAGVFNMAKNLQRLLDRKKKLEEDKDKDKEHEHKHKHEH